MNLFFLSGFTFFEAYSIAVIVSFYRAPIVLEAVLISLGIFIALTLFACQTKYDFTGWQPWLFGILSGVIVFGFVSLFFPRNNTVELFYSGAVALLFSAYIVSYFPPLLFSGPLPPIMDIADAWLCSWLIHNLLWGSSMLKRRLLLRFPCTWICWTCFWQSWGSWIARVMIRAMEITGDT